MNLTIILFFIITFVTKYSNGTEVALYEIGKEDINYYFYKNYSIGNFCHYNKYWNNVLICNGTTKNIIPKNNSQGIISPSWENTENPYEYVKLYLNFSSVLKKGTLFVGKERNIENLRFFDNSIKYIENEMFDAFTSLEGLSFYNTPLKKIDENIFTKKFGTHLKYLSLRRNNISILPPSAFQYMFNLTSLDLEENQGIGQIINDGIFTKSLANLKDLSLGNCNISVLNDDIFINVTNLEHLGLSHNPLTSIPKAINILAQLFSFGFGNTSITSIKYDKKVYNKNISVLELGYSKNLIELGDCAFCSFPNLWSLSLSWSLKLSIVHENAFGSEKDLPELADVKMDSCNISTLPEKLLKRRVLIHLKDNPIKENSILLKNPIIIH